MNDFTQSQTQNFDASQAQVSTPPKHFYIEGVQRTVPESYARHQVETGEWAVCHAPHNLPEGMDPATTVVYHKANGTPSSVIARRVAQARQVAQASAEQGTGGSAMKETVVVTRQFLDELMACSSQTLFLIEMLRSGELTLNGASLAARYTRLSRQNAELYEAFCRTVEAT